MIKRYDKDNKYLGILSSAFDIELSEELERGYKTLSFRVSYDGGDLLREEEKLSYDNYRFVIKEINMKEDSSYTVYCKPYFGELASKFIDAITGYTFSIEDTLLNILSDTDWNCVFHDKIYGSRAISIYQLTALDAIESVRKIYNCDLYFDTEQKQIEIWNKRGSYKTDFLLTTKNIRDCQIQSNTYDIITRLIPIGKDGVTIAQANGGCIWVEDYSYTPEIITGYYYQDKIGDSVELLAAAAEKIKDTSKPMTTYKIRVSALDSDDISVGDSIRIIDKVRNIDEIKRIQKIVQCPDNQKASYIELGCIETMFDDIFKDLKEGQNILAKTKSLNITDLFKRYDILSGQVNVLNDQKTDKT